MEKQIAERIASGLTTAEKIAETRKALDMDVSEYCKIQETKSLAVADGTLTLDEGLTIYAALGEVPSHFNGQPVHVKSVITSLFAELLKRRIDK